MGMAIYIFFGSCFRFNLLPAIFRCSKPLVLLHLGVFYCGESPNTEKASPWIQGAHIDYSRTHADCRHLKLLTCTAFKWGRRQFCQCIYDEHVPVRVQATQLKRLAHLWLLSGDPTATQVAEKVVMGARTWLAGCIVHWAVPRGAPECTIQIGGK